MIEKDEGGATVVEAEPLGDHYVDRAKLEKIHATLVQALSDLDELRDDLRGRPENEQISDLLAEHIPPTPSFALSELCIKVGEFLQVTVDELALGLAQTPESRRIEWISHHIERCDRQTVESMAAVVAAVSGADLYEVLGSAGAR